MRRWRSGLPPRVAKVPTRRGIALLALLLAACATPPEPAPDVTRLVAALASKPIVLLGEVHDNQAQHALRALALRRHLAGGARPVLLMEQFDRERQAALDSALARTDATVDAVIEAGSPAADRSGWDWRLYRPYLALALEYRLRIVAANVSRTDARRVMTQGLPALGFDPATPADLGAAQAQAIVAGHCGAIDAAQARPLVAAQVARDQFMARQVEAHAHAGVVLLAGNGHVRSDIGVPRWLSAAQRGRSVAIGLVEAGNGGGAARYDIAIETPAQARPDPCIGFTGIGASTPGRP